MSILFDNKFCLKLIFLLDNNISNSSNVNNKISTGNIVYKYTEI
jgi:hypothetical protein